MTERREDEPPPKNYQTHIGQSNFFSQRKKKINKMSKDIEDVKDVKEVQDTLRLLKIKRTASKPSASS